MGGMVDGGGRWWNPVFWAKEEKLVDCGNDSDAETETGSTPYTIDRTE